MDFFWFPVTLIINTVYTQSDKIISSQVIANIHKKVLKTVVIILSEPRDGCITDSQWHPLTLYPINNVEDIVVFLD